MGQTLTTLAAVAATVAALAGVVTTWQLRRLRNVPDQIDTLQAADDEIKAAVAAVGDRVTAKLNDLQAQLANRPADPRVDQIVADLHNEAAALSQIAPDAAPAPPPADTTGGTPPPADTTGGTPPAA